MTLEVISNMIGALTVPVKAEPAVKLYVYVAGKASEMIYSDPKKGFAKLFVDNATTPVSVWSFRRVPPFAIMALKDPGVSLAKTMLL